MLDGEGRGWKKVGRLNEVNVIYARELKLLVSSKFSVGSNQIQKERVLSILASKISHIESPNHICWLDLISL